jgi:hypothetical protein
MKNKGIITLGLGAAAAFLLLGSKKSSAKSSGSTEAGERVVDSGTQDVNGVRYDWRVVEYTLAGGFGGAQYQAQIRGYQDGVAQPWSACSDAGDPTSAVAGKEQCAQALSEIAAMG